MLKQCIIIGGGPAGTAAALAAAEALDPKSVLIIERDGFGGTCTNRGCIPTKFFLSRSEQLYRGGVAGVITTEWTKLLAHKKALVQGLSRSIEARCRDKGIGIVKGTAAFVGPHEIQVAEQAGGTTVVEGERIIIAAGSSPAALPGVLFDGRLVISSNEALDLDPLPKSMAIVGSGAVGSEFALVFTRLGVKVTLIEAAPRLFPVEEQDVDAVFRKIYPRLGVAVHTGDPVVGIEIRDDGAGVAVQLGSGAVVEAEKALIGIGRTLETPSLNCKAAGVTLDSRGGVAVDERLCTSQPHIYAAGDITGRMLLAHAASYMGEFAGRMATGLPFSPVPYHSIPWATFTTPEVAAVGLSLEKAGRMGLSCVAPTMPLMDSVKARIDRTTDGFFKVVVERASGKIVGGTVVGPHASDLIHIVALAVHKGMTVSDMRSFAFVHPSVSELFGDLYASYISH